LLSALSGGPKYVNCIDQMKWALDARSVAKKVILEAVWSDVASVITLSMSQFDSQNIRIAMMENLEPREREAFSI
jgi:hypothetical protein